jgi:hypothetical protein
MGPFIVVILDPFPNYYPSFLSAVKDFSIQQVISKSPVKALTKTILPRTAWSNVSSLHSYAR